MKIALTAVALLAIGALAGLGTWAAFSATTASSANSFAAGSVALADNDSDTAMLSLSNAVPGNSDTGCITISYTGSLSSSVRLYGTTSGTGLDQYLDLTVTRGSFSGSPPAFDSCATFAADATDYIGSGAGVMYSGTLQGFADSYAAGHVDPTSGSPETWASGESHVYKLQLTVQNNSLAQGKNATETFSWEARNN